MKLPPSILLSSLTLNVLLLGGLVMTWGDRRATTQVPPAPKSAPVMQAVTAKTPAAAPFRWQQLDAPDFPTFVKNLRDIGCPEPTLHDIVEGELREIYAQKLQQVTASTSGPLREAEMLKLTAEYDRLLVSLTASTTNPATAAPLLAASTASSSARTSNSVSATTAQTSGSTEHTPAPRIPLAFVHGSKPGAALAQVEGQVVLSTPATNPQLPSAETTMLQQIQNDFAAALGDSVQNPESPVYRQRWNTEVNRSNERFRALYGVNAYLRAEMQAARTGVAAP
jgi:hypothetical protein